MCQKCDERIAAHGHVCSLEPAKFMPPVPTASGTEEAPVDREAPAEQAQAAASLDASNAIAAAQK